jgi:tetratricopeptide (TPR) repeat protein
VYRHVGCIYKKKNDFDEALKYFKKAANLNNDNTKEDQKSSYDILLNMNLAEVYLEKGNIDKALSLVLKSVEDLKKARKINREANFSLLLSRIYNEQGNMELAMENGLKSYEIAVLKDIPGQLLMTSKQLEKLYRKQGSLDKAIHFSDIYRKTKNRVEKEDAKLVIQNEEHAIAMQKEQQKLQAMHANSEKARLNTLLVTGALLMSIGFGFVFYRRKKILKCRPQC